MDQIKLAAQYLGRKSISVNPLNEALTDEHKEKISDMPDMGYQAKQAHEGVFPAGSDIRHVPYDQSTEPKITRSFSDGQRVGFGAGISNTIIDHLNKHDYDVVDYGAGIAQKRGTNRKEKIGKILQQEGMGGDTITSHMTRPKYEMEEVNGKMKLKKDEDGNRIIKEKPRAMNIAEAFAADPVRASLKKKNVSLFATKNKYDVAGMSSGKGWESCMDLDDGCNAHYLPNELRHGTISVWALPHHQSEVEGHTNLDKFEPMGRVNLKKFESPEGHVIYRPESHYGAMTQGMRAAVSNWAQTHYPEKHDTIYTKHASVYNDDGKSVIVTGSPKYSQISDAIESHVQKFLDMRAEHEHDQGDFYDDDEEYSATANILEHLPKHIRENAKAHATLVTEDVPDEKYHVDRTGDDHIALVGAQDGIDLRHLSQPEHKKDLIGLLQTASSAADNAHKYDPHSACNAQKVHGDLMTAAYKSGDKESIDSMIHHATHNTYTNSDRGEWMSEVIGEHYRGPYLHELGTNQRHIEDLYHLGKQHDNEAFPDVHSDSHLNKESGQKFLYAIGKHASPEFIHSFVSVGHQTSDIDDNGIYHAFHQGLNDREDGEQLSHSLISQLNLGSGVANKGTVKPVASKRDLQNAQQGHHHEEGIEDTGQNSFYADMAAHTKFKSVHDALKTRPDTQTDEIKEGLRLNNYGLNNK